jgi:MoxR-like ATPase
MNSLTTILGDKSVKVSPAYSAAATEMVGRREQIKSVIAAWLGGAGTLPLHPLLLGDPGLGKNRIVYECARLCGKDLYIFQGHEEITADDLVCSVRFSDDPAKKMDYILSPIVTGMIRGGIVFLDEIAKIRPRALAPLVSLLDERRYLDSTILGERICAHPGFRFIAATNSSDLDNGQFPEFIQSRLCPTIQVGMPCREELEGILRSHIPGLSNNGHELMRHFWSCWKTHYGDRLPTPRESLQVFAFAFQLANYEQAIQVKPYALESNDSGAVPTEDLLEETFQLLNSVNGKGPLCNSPA